MQDFQRTGSGLVQAGDLQWRYLWGPAVDQILAEEAVDNGSDETVQWTLTDHLNTVRDIAKYDPAMDSTSIVNHLVYDAFGQVTSESNPAVDSLFLFTARPFDSDTQLQNNLNRWFDPAVGRWLSEDPMGFAGGDGNLYRYVGNGVLCNDDPQGLARECPVYGAEGIYVGNVCLYDYPTGAFDIEMGWVKVTDPQQILRLGNMTIAYTLRYRVPKDVCNCKNEEIHLVQALQSRGVFWRDPHFDSKGDMTGYPFPPYAGQQAPYKPSIVDAPNDPHVIVDLWHSWFIEVCAVCTTRLERAPYAVVIQQVLGCVSFYWYQAEPPAKQPRLWVDGVWVQNGMQKVGISARPVGPTWAEAADAYKPKVPR